MEEDLLTSPVALEVAAADERAVVAAASDDDSRLLLIPPGTPDISRTDMAAADCSLRALRSASCSALGEFNNQTSTLVFVSPLDLIFINNQSGIGYVLDIYRPVSASPPP